MIKTIEKILRKHYLQCLMTVLLTGMVLYFTAALWLSKVVAVSFNSKSDSEITYGIFYTENDKQEFIKERSVSYEVKVGQHDVEIILPADNLYKLRVDIISSAPKVIISDFLIKGDKVIKPDLGLVFMNGISKYEVKGDDVIIKSTEEKKKFVLKERFDLSGMSHIDWCRLIIISVLSFLLMYKFVQYLSKFKIEKQHSRTDIVMLAVFFALLFVPMSHISDAEQSEQENRMLAKKPQLMIDSRGGGNYGVQFDAWYNDRFFGRDTMIYLYNYLKFFIAPHGENSRAMVGENGFLWGKSYNAVDMYRNANLFTDQELETVGKHITKFVKDAKAAGVKNVYFMLSNDKESMYPEYYPSYIKKVSDTSRLEQLVDYIHTNYPQIKFFNFRDKFEKIKKDETVFCKTGTHMNGIGSYYEYYFLMNEIKKDYPDLKGILSLDDFDISVSEDINQPRLDTDIYKKFFVLPLYKKEYLRNKILSLKDKPSYKSKSSRKEHNTFVRGVNNKAKNKLSVFNIGDSFAGGYYMYLLDTFQKADRVFIGGGKPFVLYPDEAEYLYESKPDILIVSTTERFLQRFLTLEFPKNPNSSKKEN